MASTTFTSEILCPCGCGEAVTMTDEGFSATTVEVSSCSISQSRGVASSTFRKSAAIDFQPAVAQTVRHSSGLVVFA